MLDLYIIENAQVLLLIGLIKLVQYIWDRQHHNSLINLSFRFNGQFLSIANAQVVILDWINKACLI